MDDIKGVYYETQEINTEITVLFKDTPIIEDENNFSRSHYFKNEENTSITSAFKDELLKLFNVKDVKELKNIIDYKIRLMFKVGKGKMQYDKVSNTVIVYTETFKEEVIKPINDIRKLKSTVESIYKKDNVSSKDMLNILEVISNGIEKQEISEKDQIKIAKLIPNLIKKGKIKISLKDITDINKDRLKDIIKLGRDLLSKKIGVEKQLGISREQVHKEEAWQRYFELYGSYLLFGSIEQEIPQALLKINSEFRNTDSRLDIMTINRYGFIDLVELKKSDEYLFKIDKSHDNFVPTDALSTAISQINNYLMILPYSKENGELIKGAESASGMLVIGSNNSLMKKENINYYINKYNQTEGMVKLKLRKALRDLNYSYAHIQIVLYDELLDNLEQFLNQMEIELDV